MKTKIIHPIFVLILINLVLLSCQEGTDNQDQGPIKPPAQIISVDRATEMYNTYSARRVPIIKKYEDSIPSDASPFTPTRYAEYDLESIKQYIAYVEYRAKQSKVEVKTLRFYFSNYPNSDTFANGDKVKYPKRNSFFILPTMEVKGKNVGFSIEEVDGNYSAVPINRSSVERVEGMGNTKKSSVNEAGLFFSSNIAAQSLNVLSLVFNDGQLMPPPEVNDFGNDN